MREVEITIKLIGSEDDAQEIIDALRLVASAVKAKDDNRDDDENL